MSVIQFIAFIFIAKTKATINRKVALLLSYVNKSHAAWHRLKMAVVKNFPSRINSLSF